MSGLSIFNIAGSALQAQSQRMNVSASNIANADSVVGPNGQPYRAREVIFQWQPMGGQGGAQQVGGVQVAGVVHSAKPLQMQYDPGHPLANEAGYISKSNVDVVAETVNMISASRSYQANVEVINTTKSLLQRTLTLGQ